MKVSFSSCVWVSIKEESCSKNAGTWLSIVTLNFSTANSIFSLVISENIKAWINEIGILKSDLEMMLGPVAYPEKF